MNKNKTALVFGSFFAIVHLIWSVLVALGVAQPLVNFIYSLHMLANPPQVEAFTLGKAAGLVVVTFVVGYALGSLFAWLWNKLKA